MTVDVRTGIGYDIHQFDDSRPMFLGGVRIADRPGLKGHSDADVLLHAISDALLGAIAAGDIGDHFPPADKSIAGISSGEILTKALQLVRQQQFRVANVDATIIAETPTIAPFRETIRHSIADLMQLSVDRVSVKATTNESMGAIGRNEGIAAIASVLLISSELGTL